MAIKDNPFILSDPLHDRVVRLLLAKGLVTRQQVEDGWMRWLRALRDGATYPLWRELLLTPEVNLEHIFALVARTYAFHPIAISRDKTARLIDQLFHRLEDEQWNALIEALVLPVVEQGKQPDPQQRISFATFDPTHPDVRRLVASLNLPCVELRYAPAHTLIELIVEIFPQKKFLLGELVQ